MDQPTQPRASRRSAHRRFFGAVVSAALVLGAVWPVTAAEPPAVPGPVASSSSTHYQEAIAHAGDRVSFEPERAEELRVRSRAAFGTIATGPAQAPLAITAPASGREVFGFLPYWEVNDPALRLDYDVLSTIAYFSVGADRDGNLLRQDADGSTSTGWAGWTSAQLTGIIEAAHARGTRVVLTLTMFAWTSSEKTKQAAFLANEAARLNLAAQAATAVWERGADGINLDFEPIVDGQEANYVAFVQAVRQALDAFAPGQQLTVDTTGSIDNQPIEAIVAPGAADAIFIMGYDYRSAGTAQAGSIAPIGGPRYDIAETLQRYVARVPADRLILGVPYYGRAWSTVSDAPNAPSQSGTQYGASVTAVYTTAATLAEQNGRRWDPIEGSPWTAYLRENCTATYGCVTSWRELYYDDPESLGLKYDLANLYGLRGVGIWALGYDGTRPELTATLATRYLGWTPPPPGPPPVLTLDQVSVIPSAAAITWGETVVLSVAAGTLGAGAAFDLVASRDTLEWQTIQPALALDAAGAATFAYRPATNLYFRLVPLGTLPVPGPLPAGLASTVPVRVVVRQVALLRPTSLGAVRTIPLGRSVTFTTTVRPSRPELVPATVGFVFYRRTSAGWRLVGSRDVAAGPDGRASTTWRFGSRGEWYVRAIANPTPYNANSVWSPLERYSVR